MSRKPYTRPISAGWWLKKPFFIRYMAREVSSFFLGIYSALAIVGLARLVGGPEAWAGYLALLSHPLFLVFHGVALIFALYHTITWFAVTPRTTPVMVGEDFVPPQPIVIGQYVAWVVASAVVLLAAFW